MTNNFSCEREDDMWLSTNFLKNNVKVISWTLHNMWFCFGKYLQSPLQQTEGDFPYPSSSTSGNFKIKLPDSFMFAGNS